MDRDTAYRLILLHAGHELDPEQPGILGNLRPLVGVFEEDFAQIVEAIVTLHPLLSHSEPTSDRRLVFVLWDLSVRLRIYSRPGGMLQSNKLISSEEAERLARWVHVIERTSLDAVQGLELRHCLLSLSDYISFLPPERARLYEFLTPLLQEVAASADPEDWHYAELATAALGAISQSRS
jgi:hypothetical protein